MFGSQGTARKPQPAQPRRGEQERVRTVAQRPLISPRRKTRSPRGGRESSSLPAPRGLAGESGFTRAEPLVFCACAGGDQPGGNGVSGRRLRPQTFCPGCGISGRCHAFSRVSRSERSVDRGHASSTCPWASWVASWASVEAGDSTGGNRRFLRIEAEAGGHFPRPAERGGSTISNGGLLCIGCTFSNRR